MLHAADIWLLLMQASEHAQVKAAGPDLQLSDCCCTAEHFRISRDGQRAIIGGATTDVRPLELNLPKQLPSKVVVGLT